MEWIAVLSIFLVAGISNGEEEYYGELLGKFSEDAHDLKGTLYAVDERTILIKDFNYDGTGPDAFFWVGNSDITSSNTPNGQGTIIPNENGSKQILKAYSSKTIVLDLGDLTLKKIRWISVWCKQYSANFGWLLITEQMRSSLPGPREISAFSQNGHGVRSGKVTIMDVSTIKIEGFHYDGQGPDAFFIIGNGDPLPSGTKIPDENGSLTKAKAYNGKEVILHLPAGKTFYDIDYLSLYCIGAKQNFGDVRFNNIPAGSISPNVEKFKVTKYGKILGSFSEDAHELKGTLYAVNERTILIKDFNYDGKGPDAYFWVGKSDMTSSETPNSQGTIIADENGSKAILKAYTSKTILLDLGSISLREIRWISVWCKEFSANFGWLQITEKMTLSLPTPQQIPAFSRLAHGLRSGTVTLLDTNTIKIQDLSYDGQGPDAFFLIGKGNVSPTGTKIPDENGSLTKAQLYNEKEIILHLPTGKTFYDIDYLSLYCISFTQNFGEVRFEMIREGSLPPDVEQFKPTLQNCETLKEGLFNVAWEIKGNDVEVELMAAIDPNDYMSFGISGDTGRAAMVNGDVAVVWKKDGVAKAGDYHMSAYSLCSGNVGVCPDTAFGGSSGITLMSYNTINGITKAKYRRALVSNDNYDKTIQPASETQIIWAIGGVNEQEQPTKHHTRITESKQIQFGRDPSQNCKPIQAKEKKEVVPWKQSLLFAKNEMVLTASLGPTGGDAGYKAITGKQSWGIAWYINGNLIPEITVRRGSNITFQVQGGENPSTSAKYHPFYITDDPVGGYADKTAAEKQNVKIYKVKSGNTMVDKVVGKFCEYLAPAGTNPETLPTFNDFKAKLRLQCDNGNTGQFVWHVAQDTPNTVYYQCYTHNYLGWKIKVIDAGAPIPSQFDASQQGGSAASCQTFNIVMHFISFLFVLFISFRKSLY